MRCVTLKCPKCHEMLEVDVQTGSVVRHHEEVKPDAGGDFLNKRLRELDQEKARREALVSAGREKEKARPGEFDKLFRKVREESTSGKPAERPLREIDVD